jgi:hypothetical protein
VLIEQECGLVRSRRALIGGAEYRQNQRPGIELSEISAHLGQFVGVVEVVRRSLQVQELLGSWTRSERDQQEISVKRAHLGLHSTLGRVDLRDAGLDEVDAALFQCQKAGRALFERSRADQVPQLGKTGVEAVVGGHDGHIVVVGQSRPQLVGCGEAAEATTKDENACHVLQPSLSALP